MIFSYSKLATSVRQIFNSVGLEISRFDKCPRHTWLGLRHLPVRTVIDIGANRGQFARSVLALFPAARLYCFEPLSEAFDELKRWAATQSPGQVSIFQVALGEREGAVEMFLHTEHDTSSSLLRTTSTSESLYPFTSAQRTVPVNLMTLDAACAGITFEPDVLIKIDTQGYEKQVLLGGGATLKRAQTCILEINLFDLYESQASFSELINLLDEAGYRYAGNLEQVYDHNGQVIFIDAVFIRRLSGSM
jgi:FkbM family methyltransferase